MKPSVLSLLPLFMLLACEASQHRTAPLSGSQESIATSAVFAKAHAHNDYYHDRPLFDALANGFASVEADVFLVDGDLLVAHSRDELKTDRTLRALYLDPLTERVRTNGHVQPGAERFTLHIDIKSGGPETYHAISILLGTYGDLFTRVEDGIVTHGAIDVVISGNRPRALMESETLRFAGYDGRLSDIDSDAPAHFMPLISDNWKRHFTWDGKGTIPTQEREKLAQIVEKVHAKGRKIRLWATPETTAMWAELLRVDADFINTDDLPGLRDYLSSNDS